MGGFLNPLAGAANGMAGGMPPRRGLLQALLGVGESDEPMDEKLPSASGVNPEPQTPHVVDDPPTRQTAAQPYGPQPDRMTAMEDEYQRLGVNNGQPKKSLAQKIMSGVAGAAGGFNNPNYSAELMRNQQQTDTRVAGQRENLLSQIEAERRMQEQEQMTRDRLADQDRRANVGKTVTLGDKVMQWNPDSQAYDKDLGFASVPKPEVHDTDQGPIQYNAQTKGWEPIQVGGQRVGPKAQPKPDTPEQQFIDSPEEQGKSLKAKLQDYAGATQKPERGDEGTWQLDEDSQGNPILFNTKTSQTKPAPAGIAKPGTYQKKFGAANDAQQYANDYVKMGAYTGPGDEALMEKFFELAKPSSGFRMTQQQMDMLKNAQSWKNSLTARYRHATSGTWFSDEQRQQIAQTMNQLAASKNSGGGGGASLKDKVSGKATHVYDPATGTVRPVGQ